MPKTPVKAMGWFSVLKDTEGNVFALWQTDKGRLNTGGGPAARCGAPPRSDSPFPVLRQPGVAHRRASDRWAVHPPSGVDQDLESAVDHALHVEGHRVGPIEPASRGSFMTFALTRSRWARDLNTIHENTTVSPGLTLSHLRGTARPTSP